MKKLSRLVALLVCAVALQGCIAFPPLIQVEKKESTGSSSNNDSELSKRVDAMEKQLNRIEQKLDKK